jgi:hypothetical protein
MLKDCDYSFLTSPLSAIRERHFVAVPSLAGGAGDACHVSCTGILVVGAIDCLGVHGLMELTNKKKLWGNA